jgi:hypothetical protein
MLTSQWRQSHDAAIATQGRLRGLAVLPAF